MDKTTMQQSPRKPSDLSEKTTNTSAGDSCANVMQQTVSDAAKCKPIPSTTAACEYESSDKMNEEEPVLRLNSSDDEIFEDAFEDIEKLKENDANIGIRVKADKYFSDIESSDDSRAYEIGAQSEASLGEKAIDEKATEVIEKSPVSVIEEIVDEKVPELELELVDSDEESFTDSPLLVDVKIGAKADCEDESRETGEVTPSSFLEEDSTGQDSGGVRSDIKLKHVTEHVDREDSQDVVESNQESISGVLEDIIAGDNEATLSSLPFDEEEYLASALEAVLGSETCSRSPVVKETEPKIKSTKEDEEDCEEVTEIVAEETIVQEEDEDISEESSKTEEVTEKLEEIGEKPIHGDEKVVSSGPQPVTPTEETPNEPQEIEKTVDKDECQAEKPEEPEKPTEKSTKTSERTEEEQQMCEETNDDEKSLKKVEAPIEEEQVSSKIKESVETSEEQNVEVAKADDVQGEHEVIKEDQKMETDEVTADVSQSKVAESKSEETTGPEATEIKPSETNENDHQGKEDETVETSRIEEPQSKSKNQELEPPIKPLDKPSDEKSTPIEDKSMPEQPVVEPIAELSQTLSEKSPETTVISVGMDDSKLPEKDASEKKEMPRPPTPEDIEMLEVPKDDEVIEKQSDQQLKDTKDDTQSDEDESLLVIDTTFKEDNENDDVEMDSETEQTLTSAQTSDSGSDASLEVFYDKKCVNYECMHKSKNFFRVTLFVLNFYKIPKKKNKAQFVCEECFDQAIGSYENMCKTLKQERPLYLSSSFKAQELVEIIDSSDEEEDESAGDKTDDENICPKDCIALLEAELENTIRKVMQDVNIQDQLSWTKQILQNRLSTLEDDSKFVGDQLRSLQRKADDMHNTLYQCPKIKIRQLTPLDLNSGRTYNPESEMTIPPVGEIVRESIQINETYYAVKNKVIASWVPCKVMEEMDGYPTNNKTLRLYKIKFLKSKYPMLKTLSAKHMAFFNPPKVRLPIGTRVIAYFDASSLSRGKEKMLIPSAFYPGIIAEPLKHSNQFRYLVFYDDGYFQYVGHKDVRLVCQASENVWEDVHHQSRDFIHNYLTQYAVNRPMVQTQKGQSMLVDYNGKWVYARVVDVDCSLVQMLFEGQNRSEWIYRGSTRLGPVYKETNNLSQKTQLTMSRISRRTEPFIRYSNGDETTASQQGLEYQHQQSRPGEVRSVAKKSVSRPDGSTQQQSIPIVRHLNNSTIFVDDDNKPKGKVVYYTARKNLPPRPYEPHICSPTCLFIITHNLQYYSPLAKPLLSGWERQVFRQKSKKFIVYRGPCGKRMRSMEELHRYLRVTENELNVDNFDFSPETNCLAEYVIESCIVQKKDISNGKEKMPIPCVNYYDNTMPPDCIYSSERIPTDGVPLNLDSDFLVGCDCEDDCSDKARCSCWQLTYAGAKYGMPNVPHEMVGYQYKRLYEHVPTGIYECNSRCKCQSNCVNRVVQQPLQSKLQVFKTSNRGWGLRCINDVPRGSFICVYAGHLLTEQKANEGGLDAGDEYFAELDYIEVAEQIKEGYESDVPELEEEEELYDPEKDDDDDEFVVPNEAQKNRAFSTRLRTRRATKTSTDAEHDSQERQVINFEPNKTMGQPDHSSEKPSIRKLYGRDEACYIMDAKITGNLGRYFNHSCSPNLFVQNVFVDTHDLRFPWVAFFAFTHIRAGTELTWNYNYEVGVVPGKVLYCQCGAPNCRQRLL